MKLNLEVEKKRALSLQKVLFEQNIILSSKPNSSYKIIVKHWGTYFVHYICRDCPYVLTPSF